VKLLNFTRSKCLEKIWELGYLDFNFLFFLILWIIIKGEKEAKGEKINSKNFQEKLFSLKESFLKINS